MLVLLIAIALEARIVHCEENTPRRRWQEMKYYLTSVRYGMEHLFENINCDKPMQDVPMYNAFERDIAVLNMFFGDSTVFGKWFGFVYLLFSHVLINSSKSFLNGKHLFIWNYAEFIFFTSWPPEYERSQKMTGFEFISNIGGLCGLCLGFSFVSAVEIFYWFAIRLFTSLGRAG